MNQNDGSSARLDRVESEVGAIRTEMGGIKADVGGLTSDVRALGGILGRIERGVEAAQAKTEEKEQASRPNMLAIISVLISIISVLIGGAWMISGNMSRMDERDKMRDRELSIITQFRDREADRTSQELNRLSERSFKNAEPR